MSTNAIVASMVFYSSACFSGDFETTNTTNVCGGEANGFRLTIGTTNNVFRVDQRIDLKLSLKNVSTNTLTFKVQDDLMNYVFEVTGPRGEKLQTTDFGDHMLRPAHLYHQSFETLEPRQTFDITFPLQALFVMTNTGEYQVRVSREVDGKWASAGPLKLLLAPNNLH